MTKAFSQIQVIIVKNQELIPAEEVIYKGENTLDYSFVTGESVLVNKI